VKLQTDGIPTAFNKKHHNFPQTELAVLSTLCSFFSPFINNISVGLRFFASIIFFLAPTSFEVSGDSTCQPFICVKVAKFMLYGAEILIRKLANLALQASAGKIHRPAPHFPPHT